MDVKDLPLETGNSRLDYKVMHILRGMLIVAKNYEYGDQISILYLRNFR